MDQQTAQILTALQNTLSPDNAVRHAAEEQLSQYDNHPDFLVELLRLVCSDGAPAEPRQAAAIHFKRLANSRWKPLTEKLQEIPAQHKAAIRGNLLVALATVPPPLASQLTVAIQNVALHDYPEHWPDLVPQAVALLQTGETPKVRAGLLALRAVSGAFKMRRLAHWGPLFNLTAEVQALLLQIFQALAAQPWTDDNARLLLLVIKFFVDVTSRTLPDCWRRDTTSFAAWIEQLLKTLARPLQDPTLDDPDQPQFKCKMRASLALSSLFRRFGIKASKSLTFNETETEASQSSEDDKIEKQFAKLDAQLVQHFAPTFAQPIAQVVVELLMTVTQNVYMPPRLRAELIDFLALTLNQSKSYTYVRPLLPTLFSSVMFATIRLNEDDLNLWKEDPREYLRLWYDEMDEYYDPRKAALSFLVDLTKRGKKRYTELCMQSVVQLLVQYNQAAPAQRDPVAKDACLQIVGAFSDVLSEVEQYKNSLQMMLLAHVFPEFRSEHGFLRARACWVFSRFSDVPYPDKETFAVGIRSLLANLDDAELPVRVQAAVALGMSLHPPELNDEEEEEAEPLDKDDIKAKAKQQLSNAAAAGTNWDVTSGILKPLLGHLFEAYIKLLNETDNEQLLLALQTLVYCFPNDIAPFAASLTQRLMEAFLRMLTGSERSSDEEESLAMAASGCLEAIHTVIESISDTPSMLLPCEQALMPLFTRILTDEDLLEHLDEVIDILTLISYYGRSISDSLWQLFPLMCSAAQGHAKDCLHRILTPMDNFISYGPNQFLQLGYMDKTMGVFTNVATDLARQVTLASAAVEKRPLDEHETAQAEANVGEAALVIEVVMLVCRNRVDAYIQPILEITLATLPVMTFKAQQCLMINLIANAIYYNPLLALQVLEASQSTSKVIDKWYELREKFGRKHDKQLSVLSLSSLFLLPAEQLPASIQSQFLRIMEMIVFFSTELDQQRAEDEEEEEDAEDDDADEDIAEGDGPAGKADSDSENEEDDIADEGSEDDYYDESLGGDMKEMPLMDEDSIEVQTAIDDLNEKAFFAEHFAAFMGRHPQVQQALLAAMPAEQRAGVEALVQKGIQSKADDERKAQEEATAAAAAAGAKQ